MSIAKISLIGIEGFLQSQGRSLFDDIVLPDGLDKDVLTGSIMLRAGEFEALYQDANFMQTLVKLWFKKYYPTFDKWNSTLNASYNPLDNYDRHEEYTDTHEGSRSGSSEGENSSNNTRTDDLTQTTDLTSTTHMTRTDDLATTNDVETENKVSAFDAATYSNKDKQTVDQDGTQTGTVKNDGTVEDDGTVKNTGTVKDAGGGDFSESHSDEDSYTNEHTAHLWGNIGVTTSQQMAESELQLRKNYNIFNMISDLFVSEFCILIY